MRLEEKEIFFEVKQNLLYKFKNKSIIIIAKNIKELKNICIELETKFSNEKNTMYLKYKPHNFKMNNKNFKKCDY